MVEDFEFSVTNNQVEYEAFFVVLMLDAEMEEDNVKLRTVSQLVISKVKTGVHSKDPLLQ